MTAPADRGLLAEIEARPTLDATDAPAVRVHPVSEIAADAPDRGVK